MIDYLFFSVMTYYSYLFVEYGIHRFSHYKHKYNLFYYNHIKHHKKHYDYKNVIAKSPFKCDTYFYMPVSALLHLPILLISYYLVYQYLYYYSLFIITEVNILLFISDYIHTNIHIKENWLEDYSFFRKCREIHKIHHKNYTKNYSLSGYDNTIDYLFETYQ